MERTLNQQRLIWLVKTFGIPVKKLADLSGMSAPYVSRILHGDKALGSLEFYIRLESELEKLIGLRTKRLFNVPSIETDKLEAIPCQNK